MGLSFPYRCSILFYEVGALNPGRVLAERGALIFTQSQVVDLILITPLIIQYCS